jgi:hypothetical protein
MELVRRSRRRGGINGISKKEQEERGNKWN